METSTDEFDTLVPLHLERAWREDPARFRAWLDVAYAARPESELLQAWQARLNYSDPGDDASPGAGKDLLLYTVLISTVSWAIAKLPEFITVSDEWFYPRFIPFLGINALVVYFTINRGVDKTLLLKSVGAGAAILLILLLLPDRISSDSITMALIHMPFVLLSLLGFVFCRGRWHDIKARNDYIRYGGELLIFTALILLGGGVLSAMAVGLFALVGIPIEQWWFSFVGLWGAMSAPLIATWLWDQVMHRDSKLGPMIANVFSPLFLLMSVGYLLALLGEQRSPFSDREFLIIFNALLLIVWAITVLSITGRDEQASPLMDLTNLSLVFVTLIIDAIALAAIVYRTLEFGITPNRVAVTGANLLIFVHLVWIFIAYAKTFRGSGNSGVINTTIARYLPVYTAWSVFVVIVLPVIFSFR